MVHYLFRVYGWVSAQIQPNFLCSSFRQFFADHFLWSCSGLISFCSVSADVFAPYFSASILSRFQLFNFLNCIWIGCLKNLLIFDIHFLESRFWGSFKYSLVNTVRHFSPRYHGHKRSFCYMSAFLHMGIFGNLLLNVYYKEKNFRWKRQKEIRLSPTSIKQIIFSHVL